MRSRRRQSIVQLSALCLAIVGVPAGAPLADEPASAASVARPKRGDRAFTPVTIKRFCIIGDWNPVGASCGDGFFDDTEACDRPGEQGTCPAGLTCRYDCTRCEAVCGDGRPGPGEACDPPGLQGPCPPGEVCSFDCGGCTPCGNGSLDVGEICDPPLMQGTCAAGQVCSGDCKACEAICGDGEMAPGEACEPPDMPGLCGGVQVCSHECETCTSCGNGAVDPGETCDPAAGGAGCPSGAICRGDCGACDIVCGDGRVGPGEVCDPPGSQSGCPPGETCRFDCVSCTTCGNGAVDSGEACDAGLGCSPGMTCEADCSACISLCGDGALDPGEVCDPTVAGGSCPTGEICLGCAECTACGNATIDPGEACEPPGGGTACGAGEACATDCLSCVTCPTALPPPAAMRAVDPADLVCAAPDPSDLIPCQGTPPDPAADYCGWEVTERLLHTINGVIVAFDAALGKDGWVKRVAAFDLYKQIANWDITEMLSLGSPDAYRCGKGKGNECVQVCGMKQWVFDVNYVLWGLATRLYGEQFFDMTGFDTDFSKVVAYKTATAKANELTSQLVAWYEVGREIGAGVRQIESPEKLCELVQKHKLKEKGEFKKGDYRTIGFCPVQPGHRERNLRFGWKTWITESADERVQRKFTEVDNARNEFACKADRLWFLGLASQIERMPWCADCERRLRPLVAQLQIVLQDARLACPPESGQPLSITQKIGCLVSVPIEANAEPIKAICDAKKARAAEDPPNPDDFGNDCSCRCTRGGMLQKSRANAPNNDCGGLEGKACDEKLGGYGIAFECVRR